MSLTSSKTVARLLVHLGSALRRQLSATSTAPVPFAFAQKHDLHFLAVKHLLHVRESARAEGLFASQLAPLFLAFGRRGLLRLVLLSRLRLVLLRLIIDQIRQIRRTTKSNAQPRAPPTALLRLVFLFRLCLTIDEVLQVIRCTTKSKAQPRGPPTTPAWLREFWLHLFVVWIVTVVGIQQLLFCFFFRCGLGCRFASCLRCLGRGACWHFSQLFELGF